MSAAPILPLRAKISAFDLKNFFKNPDIFLGGRGYVCAFTLRGEYTVGSSGIQMHACYIPFVFWRRGRFELRVGLTEETYPFFIWDQTMNLNSVNVQNNNVCRKNMLDKRICFMYNISVVRRASVFRMRATSSVG